MGIHGTAIVSDGADIAPSAEIGPGVVIEGGVKIGPNVKIMPNAHIFKGTEIGEGTAIYTGAVIGNDPQDYGYTGGDSFTKIGKNNIIREYVTIHRGTEEGSATVIGDNNFIMVQVHIGHNTVLGNNIIIAPAALLAGRMLIEDGVFISGGVVFHQFVRIGKLAMIGGFTGVNKDVPPYVVCRGPSMIRGVNLVGLRRAKVPRESIKEIREAYKIFFKSSLTTEEALSEMRKTLTSEEVGNFAKFIEESQRGICKYKYNREEYFE